MSPINMKSCCSSIVFGYVVHPEMYGFSQQTFNCNSGRNDSETMERCETMKFSEMANCTEAVAPSIAEGIEQLCLGEELTAVVASKLGED